MPHYFTYAGRDYLITDDLQAGYEIGTNKGTIERHLKTTAAFAAYDAINEHWHAVHFIFIEQIRYKYKDFDGQVFTCRARSLEICREKRRKWQQFKRPLLTL